MNDGRKIPLLGLGAHDIHSKQAVLWALESGYRLIDTASRYHNEQSVGEAVRCSNIPRCEIYVVTKVYFTEHGYKETMDAFYKSLTRLGLGYVDLYLIHFPVPSGVVGSWQAMIDLRSRGLIRSIGVSNFNIQHLEALRQQTGVVPAVNQIEVHPFLQMKELTQYCKRHNITIQAFSPLTKGEKLCDPILSYVAKKYNKTTAQILVRWSLQKGYACIPKSAQLERIKENAKVFDFSIDMADMELIDGLEENYRTGRDKILWPWEG
ncbi:predicted protein [Nematostella vectensis]|uniref:NADP-dependent oxidoreductase domain-containing protein n=1 Tax=Nematostella vectensis TaxID=45351 RepID=A7S9F3_NEMVE|nr:predicted protein [Nematostella vectensis]|eukprot:XP_001631757.1 predicted protein [Nematostella vectensis]